jgi:hypothetical protein
LKRRDFIKTFACLTASALPLVPRAQPSQRVRRIEIILPAAVDDAEFQSWVGAFLQAFAQLNWTIGRNMLVDIRWATPDAANIRKRDRNGHGRAGRDRGCWHLDGRADPTGDTYHPVVFSTVLDPLGAGGIFRRATPPRLHRGRKSDHCTLFRRETSRALCLFGSGDRGPQAGSDRHRN